MTDYTGTGTRAATPAAVAAGALLAECRAALADDGGAPTFDDAMLLGFLNEAMREYSQHLPRLGVARLAAQADARAYALPGDTLAVLDVEYPEGREPPAYLRRVAYKSERFLWSADAYDFLPRHDLNSAPRLLLSFSAAAGETLAVRHTQPHATAATSADYLSVPAEHHHVLLQYVLFAAARRLQAAEQAAPTGGGSLLMAQLAANARRHELAYLNALNRILSQRAGEGIVVAWG